MDNDLEKLRNYKKIVDAAGLTSSELKDFGNWLGTKSETVRRVEGDPSKPDTSAQNNFILFKPGEEKYLNTVKKMDKISKKVFINNPDFPGIEQSADTTTGHSLPLDYTRSDYSSNGRGYVGAIDVSFKLPF